MATTTPRTPVRVFRLSWVALDDRESKEVRDADDAQATAKAIAEDIPLEVWKIDDTWAEL